MKKIYYLLLIIFSCTSGLFAQEAGNNTQNQKEVIIDISSSESIGAAEIYIVVDEEAEPKGGKKTFAKLMKKNLKYPSEARKAGVEGRVFVSIVVDERGNVATAEIPKGHELGYGLDEEAIRVLKLTKWVPGKKGGKVVKQKMIIPVNFEL